MLRSKIYHLPLNAISTRKHVIKIEILTQKIINILDQVVPQLTQRRKMAQQ